MKIKQQFHARVVFLNGVCLFLAGAMVFAWETGNLQAAVPKFKTAPDMPIKHQYVACGDTIKSPGTYQINQDLRCPGTGVTIDASNVVLECLDDHSIEYTGSDYANEPSGVEINPGHSNITVQFCTIKKFMRGIFAKGSSGREILDLHLRQNLVEESVKRSDGWGGAGITLNYVLDSDVEQNESRNNETYGFLIQGAPRLTLTSNIAKDNKKAGFYMYIEPPLLASVSFIDNIALSNHYHGFYLLGSDQTILTGNQAVDNMWSGFYIGASDFVSLRENTAGNNVDDGLEIENSHDAELQKNTAIQNGRNGIYVSRSRNTKIIGNSLQRNGWEWHGGDYDPRCFGYLNAPTCNGLTIDTDSDGFVIQENSSVENAEHGIYVFKSLPDFILPISDNKTQKNRDAGIWFSNVDNADSEGMLEVQRNTLSGDRIGVAFYKSSGFGLRFSDSAHGASISATDVGVYLYGAEDIVIEQNRITGIIEFRPWEPIENVGIYDNVLNSTSKRSHTIGLDYDDVAQNEFQDINIMRNTIVNNNGGGAFGLFVKGPHNNMQVNNNTYSGVNGIYLKNGPDASSSFTGESLLGLTGWEVDASYYNGEWEDSPCHENKSKLVRTSVHCDIEGPGPVRNFPVDLK